MCRILNVIMESARETETKLNIKSVYNDPKLVETFRKENIKAIKTMKRQENPRVIRTTKEKSIAFLKSESYLDKTGMRD